ncbi:hypothetical protein NIES2119_08080 [[Phormidium ambiguum] IAM M-71]|uniref:Uncharacterized protein n=1 Tax=[Phormidium ambiguum] IAM M-71 TaxID=454136 RepID=A0A1U7INY5_9CYAN|nr:hypothetical protein [Phormidium ambiguum]OKH39078.1 hypothetical protein NIES2119_08080 [Phormidium ambiguum IAM M-71]
MNDVTLEDLVTALASYPDIAAWWDAAAALPAETNVNEFFAKTLLGLHLAANTVNSGRAAGTKIDGYPAPSYGTSALDSASGVGSRIVTYSVRTRVPDSLNTAFSPLT